MTSNKQHIVKGYYQYSQINNFISVKNFMFVRNRGENHLLIRFSNDSDFTVNSMTFTVLQLDSSGNVLGKKKVTLGDIEFLPGSTFASNEGIVVADTCSDFKLFFSEAVSGNYLYRMRKGEIITYYRKSNGLPTKSGSSDIAQGKFSVKPRRFGKPGLALFLTITVLLFSLALNAYRLFSIYYDAELEKEAEQTEEITAEETEETFAADLTESLSFPH